MQAAARAAAGQTMPEEGDADDLLRRIERRRP
jgi:hypothetical protein